jgi:hypothetical protein
MAVVVALLDFFGHNMMPLSEWFRRKEAVSRVNKLTCVMLTSFIVRVDECIPVFISEFSEEKFSIQIRLFDATSSV